MEGEIINNHFKDIVGQEYAVSILKEAILKDAISQTYLFYGPDGVGKLTTAKALAKATNCKILHPQPSQCKLCQKIQNLQSQDIKFIKPINNSIHIDTIKEVKKFLYYKPIELKRKFCIIDDAHLLTIEAANSFLKLLEETSIYNTIILITPNYYSLLPTIVSRAQKIRFSLLKEEDICTILERRYNINKQKSKTIAKLALGSLKKAEKLLKDSFFNINILMNIFSELKNDGYIFPTTNKILTLYKDKLEEFIDFLLEYFHDILLLKPSKEVLLIIEKIILAKYMFSKNINKALLIDKLLLSILPFIKKEKIQPPDYYYVP